MANKCVFLVLCAAMVGTGEATTFLKATPEHERERVSEQDVQTSLLAEIEGSLGSGIAAKRVTNMKSVLAPMFTSLPKNQHGNLDHVTGRYALHRAFVQRHGWSISGLDPAGGAWNSSSARGILKDQVPAYVQNLFEQRSGGRGLGLHEMAVFAATLEHLIHNEAIGRLGSALTIHSLSPMDLMTVSQVDQVLDTYMLCFILGENIATISLRKIQEYKLDMRDFYMAWPETQGFIRKTRREIAKDVQQFDFAKLVQVTETVSERFGKFQDSECRDIKAKLMKMEDRGTGRVRLSEFYRPGLTGESWQFAESVAYLQSLGALDESNADEPRVMIPNYLTAQANCIGSGDYYAVCCIDECEDLMGHLEKAIAAPEATPARISELIAALPSSSTSAPRSLSATLRTRLDSIADHHGGYVQFHGRLFAQWMHHAYPRECPYPHMSDTTNQISGLEFGETESRASDEEVARFTSKSNSSSFTELESVEDMHDLMMWSHEEELLFPHVPRVPSSTSFMAKVRNMVVLLVFASVVVGLARSVASPVHGKEKAEKFMV